MIENNTDEVSNPYQLSISLHALEHLGINLYSNVTAVLTEAVANSYDADAENVWINLDVDSDEITIRDDGHGMNVSEMNDKYLTVAYKRRGANNDNQLSEVKKRPVMGRKGLGKLSLFSIANQIEVQSVRDGTPHGCIMRVKDIRASMALKESKYKPLPLDESEVLISSGTMLKLTDLNKSRLSRTRTSLPQHLSRRFSVLGSSDFKVFVNEQEITAEDRGDLKVVEFLWNIGGSEYGSDYSNIVEIGKVSSRLQNWPTSWNIKGWFGTSPKPADMKTSAGNLNGIVVLARGRLIHENILKEVSDAKHFSHYITGQIEADFLDDSDQDVATSDRQRLIEDSEEVQQLVAYLKTTLSREVEPQWNKWRDKYNTTKLKKQHPKIVDWLGAMDKPLRREADKVIGMIARANLEDVEDRKELLKQGVVAFERLRLKGMANQLQDTSTMDTQKILSLIGSIDDLEASLYRDIVKGRMSIIRAFHSAVNENAKEKILQEKLFEDLWLIDPAWERASGSEVIETSLKDESFFSEASLSKEEAAGRIDIAYKTYAGKHIIIELKRASVVTPALVLADQGKRYVRKLKKILKAQNVLDPHIEVIFVVGKPLDETPEELNGLMKFVSEGSSVKTYHQLINGALNGYSKYLEEYKKVRAIDDLVESL